MVAWLSLARLLALLTLTLTAQAGFIGSPHEIDPRILKLRNEGFAKLFARAEADPGCQSACQLLPGERNVRRGILSSLDFDYQDGNQTEHTPSLQKRVWKMSADTSVNPPLVNQEPGSYTDEVVAAYVSGQTLTQGTYDNQYGQMAGLVTPNSEAAVAQSSELGDTGFQFGTFGVYGCQVITVVSPRRVWMAHFWESYTNGEPGSDDVTEGSESLKAYDDRLTAFLTNRQITQSSFSPVYDAEYQRKIKSNYGTNHPYLTPQGSPVDKAQFQTAEDNNGEGIEVFIGSPRRYVYNDKGERIGERKVYPNRVARLERQLQNYFGSKARISTYYYRADKSASFTSGATGKFLFQYDPNGPGSEDTSMGGTDDKPTKQWRLFYEEQNTFGAAR